ncbi:MAG: S41 family peptidase [Erysipelotrichaceae bacterium]|nr:S41 family peptidase [Erysipelotrichaceae bacterium]
MNEENENIYLDLKKKPLESERKEIRQKRKKTILMVVLCVLIFLTGFGIGFFLPRTPNSINYSFTSVLQEIEYILQNRYLYSDQSDEFVAELEDKALKGMTTFEDDPYTYYMSEEELNSFYSGINQSFVGIGIQYTKVSEAALVTKVFFDSPGERAGLKEGDMIIEIDGVSLADKNADEIKELALGEEGSEVRLTVLRDTQTIIIPVIRGTVDYTVLCDQVDDYLYLVIESFGSNTGKEIMNYLDHYSNIKKIIIDVRDNGGGFQSSVSEVCGLFIGNNEVYLQQQDNSGNMFSDLTKCSKTYSFDKIVVLVNQNTASAAEVFAICMKEKCDTATIVGTTTYGKGVIQNTTMLSNGGSLKFTDYYWYSPNGISIHKTGVEPDITVENDEVWTLLYEEMADDETFVKEDVSDVVRLCEKCLKFLGYPVEHTNGYFDESFETIINEYKNKQGMEEDGVLTKDIYEAILSSAVYEMSANESLDAQLVKAKELMK